ncbi:YegP family protein [Hymenobacter cyanobacteriorum]|uniref:YegP family protein n=1 Tax=Hymenobacter cyanobacteriorum TaxID=2926463 RepID=UPI003BAF2370
MKGFEFYQDKDHPHQWRWRLKDENGHTVADSAEGYHHKNDCEHGAAVFTRDGVNAPEHEGKKGGGPVYEYFLDHAQQWRWHFQAANNKIVADSGSKTFESAAEAQKGIAKVRELLKGTGNGGGTPPATGGGSGGGVHVPPAAPAPGPRNPPQPPKDRQVG